MNPREMFYDIPKNLGLLKEESFESIEALLPFTREKYLDMPAKAIAPAIVEVENELGDFLAIAAIALPEDNPEEVNCLLELALAIGKEHAIVELKACDVAYDAILSLTSAGQVASKCQRFGLHHVWPDGAARNSERLRESVNNILNFAIALDTLGTISLQNIINRVPVKYERLAKNYHGYDTGKKA